MVSLVENQRSCFVSMAYWKQAFGERADARFLVVLTLKTAGPSTFWTRTVCSFAGHAAEGHGALAGLVGGKAHGFIDVAVGVAGDGDGLFPVAHDRLDGIEQDRRAKDRAVQDGADGAVRAFPHLSQLRVLGHPLGIRRDGRALDGHAVFSRGQRRVDGDLILRLVAVQQAKVIILGLQLDERADQLVLIIFQRTLVISSPSISTSGVFIWIFSMRFSLSALGVVVHQTAVEQDLPLVIGQAPDVQHEGRFAPSARRTIAGKSSLPCPTSFRTSGTKTQSPG